MIISIEQLLNIPGIRVLSIKVEEHLLELRPPSDPPVDGTAQKQRSELLRQVPHPLGKPNGHHHQLLHQPFVQRLGRRIEQQNQSAQAPRLWG